MHVTFEDVILIFVRDLKTNLCKHNQKDFESVNYIYVYAKGLLNLAMEKLQTRIYFINYVQSHRDFDLKYIQGILLLHNFLFLYHYMQCLGTEHFKVCV